MIKNGTNIISISWLKLFSMGLLYMFIHFNVCSPYLNDDLSFLTPTELCDKEGESENNEIENEKEFELPNFELELLYKPLLSTMEPLKIDCRLNFYSEVTTPPPDFS